MKTAKRLKNECAWSVHWENSGIEVIDCTTCGFKHQFPYPRKSTVAEFYKDEYYEKIKPQYLQNVEKEYKNRSMWAADKFAVIEKYCKSSTGKKPKILDVGCSFGVFLAYFKERGWECVGVEPSLYAAAFAHERFHVQIHQALLENISYTALGGPFDVVHIKETLDHLCDPAGFIERCAHELLAPGGILCIETANQFSEMQMAIVESSGCPMWWIVPDHIGYFDRKSLNALVSRSGFSIIYEMATFPMELFPLMGDHFVLNPETGPQCHHKRLHFEDFLQAHGLGAVRIHFYEALAKEGFGRGIIQFSQLS